VAALMVARSTLLARRMRTRTADVIHPHTIGARRQERNAMRCYRTTGLVIFVLTVV
jgi:hypothetical protein